MSHIDSIGAGMFSSLCVAVDADGTVTPATYDKAGFDALFTTEIASIGGTASVGTFYRIKNVREFPAMGTPPNIVNVPTFGQKSSQQIQGQSDAPNIEITINYVPAEWASTAGLGVAATSGKTVAFRFALANAQPAGYASSAGSLGTVQNTYWYWTGKIEAILVTPSLSDANQATVTITLQSDLYGAYTV
jgi:hypothetical protein